MDMAHLYHILPLHLHVAIKKYDNSFESARLNPLVLHGSLHYSWAPVRTSSSNQVENDILWCLKRKPLFSVGVLVKLQGEHSYKGSLEMSWDCWSLFGIIGTLGCSSERCERVWSGENGNLGGRFRSSLFACRASLASNGQYYKTTQNFRCHCKYVPLPTCAFPRQAQAFSSQCWDLKEICLSQVMLADRCIDKRE